MKYLYIEKNFRSDALYLIETMNRIVTEYVNQGYVLTVRQLYYQLVARAVIANTIQDYKKVASIINDAKLAGLMDWDAIEDRTRDFIKRGHWTSGESILRSAAQSYHQDLWATQETRVFVVVEKEALVGVFERVCHEYDVPLLAARGYPSGSVLREFAITDIQRAANHGQYPVILHFGDHDPSGINMTRDLRDRISMFAEFDVELRRIALNMPQIEQIKPPENPAKSTDSRYREYRKKFGTKSWELDALTPTYLSELATRNITTYIDPDAWEATKEEIEGVKGRIENLADMW